MGDRSRKKDQPGRQFDEPPERVADSERPRAKSSLSKHSISAQDSMLDLVLDSLPYPFYVIDAHDYTIKLANSAAKFGRLTKASTCYALTHKSNRPCGSDGHPCPVDQIRETNRPVTVEHLHYDSDGSPRIVEVHAFPVFDSEGNVAQIIEYVLDVTERKAAEDALKWELAVNSALSELYGPLTSLETSIGLITRIILEQAKALTGSRHGYVSEIDPSTGDNVSHTLTDMLKGQCGISGKNRKIVFPRRKDGLFPALWGHALNTGEEFYTNSPKKHPAAEGIPKGHIPVNRFLSVPVMLAGKLVGQIALADKDGDYTERELKAIHRLSEYYALALQRNRAEQELRESEQRFKQIADTAEEWIWEVDAHGLYTYASPVVEKILGWEPSEIVFKKHFYDFFKPDERKGLKKAAFEVFSRKESFRNFINANVHRDGPIVILETSAVPILDERGNLLGYRGADTDITERKAAEDALRKAHDELDNRVKQCTEELRESYEQRALIRELFGAYLSDEVAAEILESPEGFKLGGEMRDMTVLISDLRGFTAITEALQAPEVVKIINLYLEKMIPIIASHDGTIDEFTGDGILVFFGAPRLLPDHSSQAVACALEMQGAMRELNKEYLQLGLPQLEMGIGVSRGRLVVGNIGSERRRKYGAVGSPINVAFRLQEKSRPGEILVTKAVKDTLGDRLQTGSHWQDSLKGIGKTIIYRVTGMKKG